MNRATLGDFQGGFYKTNNVDDVVNIKKKDISFLF